MGVGENTEGYTVDMSTIAVPPRFSSTLGAYWQNSTITADNEQCVLVAIAAYGSNILKSTPQYNFTQGMKEFGEVGYQAT